MEPAGMRQRSVLHREGWAAAEEKVYMNTKEEKWLDKRATYSHCNFETFIFLG